MTAEPLPYPAEVLRECDIYPAPSRWISFPIASLFAECAAGALICTCPPSRLLSQPVPPTLFGSAPPVVRGAGSALPHRDHSGAFALLLFPLTLLWCPPRSLSHRLVPHTPKGFPLRSHGSWCPQAPARLPSSQPFCAGLCEPEPQESRGQKWQCLGRAGSWPSPARAVQGAARGI